MNYSRLNEQEAILSLIREKEPIDRTCVDIGASVGDIWSNVYSLLMDGWVGLGIECDPEKVEQLKAAYAKAPHGSVREVKCTPENVESILADHGIPENFGVLSLDIDGYDYHVLKSICRSFKPEIVCCEVNLIIPPKVMFSVKYDPDYRWNIDPFFGMSISALEDLLSGFGYKLRFLIEDNAVFSRFGNPVDVQTLWESQLSRINKAGGPNAYAVSVAAQIGNLQSLEEVKTFIDRMWPNYSGKFEVW